MSHYEINSGKLLTPFQRKLLEKSLQDNLTESYHQRIQIMLLADEGKTQAEICRALGCCAATVRHWTHIARTGMAHQWQDCPIGRRKSVNDQHLERLKELVSNSPRDYGYPFRQWTGTWLSRHLAKEFGIDVTPQHINRLLKQMGLSTRPKPNCVKETINQQINSSQISISDLKSTALNSSFEILPIKFAPFVTDSSNS
jgi:transposase